MAGAGVASPRMQALWDDYARRGAPAVDAFWVEVEADGGPLIEPIAGDPGHSSVTFIWRLEEPDQQVVLAHGPLGAGELDPLDHLGTSDLAFGTYRVANDLRNAYWFVLDPPRSLAARSAEEWEAIQRRREAGSLLRPDPLNRRIRPHYSDPLGPETAEPGHSVVELSAAPRSIGDLEPAAPSGALTAHRFESALLEEPRTLWVYTPAGYDDLEEACDLLIVFDGHRALDAMGIPAILDQLIAAGELRPTVAVCVESLFDYRHLELPCHEPFAEFLATELLPWAQASYRITDDPRRTTLAGASYGGLAASFAALQHPERFGNALSQSGPTGGNRSTARSGTSRPRNVRGSG